MTFKNQLKECNKGESTSFKEYSKCYREIMRILKQTRNSVNNFCDYNVISVQD